MIRRLLRSPLLLVLILAIPAFLPLAAPGYFIKAHDARHSVFFLVEFDQAIRDGAIWPVWGPDHAIGFGYPLWLLYAPLIYYVAEAFHLLGLGYVAAVKATWLLCFLLGALGMYRLARRWWGPAAGVVAALAYTYAPYHLAQIYVRAALAEFAALAWFPWVLLAFADLWARPSPRRAALAAAAFGILLLTHTVSTVIFVPLLAGFLLLELAQDWRARRSSSEATTDEPSYAEVSPTPVAASGFAGPGKEQENHEERDLVPSGLSASISVYPRPVLRSVAWSVAALALGSMLAAIFLLPMVLERGYVAEAQWVHGTYDYSLHFVYPSQFFDPKWGYGYSVPGPNDGMSFQLGVLVFVGAVGGSIAALSRRGKGLSHRAEALFMAGASAIALFAMTPAAKSLWDVLPLVNLVQFPWRLLALIVMTLALLAGAGTAWLEQRLPANVEPGAYVYLAALALVLASFPYTRPELHPVRPEDESPRAVIDFELEYPDMRGMTRWSERLPENRDSPLIEQYLAGEPLRRAAIVAGKGTIVEQSSAGASARAVVRADEPLRLWFYTYYFPGWRATLDGRPVEIAPDPPNGLIGIDVPPGEHEVAIRFGATPLRRLAAGISLLSLAIITGLSSTGKWNLRFGP